MQPGHKATLAFFDKSMDCSSEEKGDRKSERELSILYPELTLVAKDDIVIVSRETHSKWLQSSIVQVARRQSTFISDSLRRNAVFLEHSTVKEIEWLDYYVKSNEKEQAALVENNKQYLKILHEHNFMKAFDKKQQFDLKNRVVNELRKAIGYEVSKWDEATEWFEKTLHRLPEEMVITERVLENMILPKPFFEGVLPCKLFDCCENFHVDTMRAVVWEEKSRVLEIIDVKTGEIIYKEELDYSWVKFNSNGTKIVIMHDDIEHKVINNRPHGR